MVNTYSTTVNHSLIKCVYEEGICGILYNTLPQCKECDWNKPLDMKYSYNNTASMWQLCPKCNGNKTTESVQSDQIIRYDICKVCNGKGIINTFTGNPPK